jgi:AraC-like DNA-binding protein
MEKIINTIVWGAIIQGLILALLYMSSRKHRSRANTLLGLFLLCFVFEAMTMWLPFDYIGTYAISPYFALPEVKLLFPILFLHYVTEKLGVAQRFGIFLKTNYALVIAVNAITLTNILIFISNGKSIYDYFSWNTVSNVFLANQYYAFFLTIIAMIISIREVLRYEKIVKNEYSDFDMLEIKWLWHFIFGVVPITLMWGLELIRIAFGGVGMSNFVLLTWGFIIVYIYFLSFKAFRHKNLFEDIPERKDEQDISIVENDMVEKKDYKELSQQIKSIMESKKYYLNHDLTIYDLSKAMKMSSRLLSSCINRNLGFNFTEWVNNYRVNEAMILLNDPKKNHYSIEGIGVDSGFKSRSAMYKAFKKKTGQTPGYFRHD